VPLRTARTVLGQPILEESYQLILDALDRHVRTVPFLFGSRPSLADFGLYGPLQIPKRKRNIDRRE